MCTGLVVTGGWDNTVRLWDPRQQQALVYTMPQADRYAVQHHYCVSEEMNQILLSLHFTM